MPLLVCDLSRHYIYSQNNLFMTIDHQKDYRSSQGPWLDVQNMQRVVCLLKI